MWCILAWFMLSATAAHAQYTGNVRQDTLKEIVIKSRASIKISGDTVTYVIDSSRNPLATVEDALRKLPGINVEAGGKITVQGKPVEKIFLDGKEYPAADIRTLTQNMPAEMLDKVQVSDWYDDAEQLSGIRKDAEKKAINLQLKNQYKKGLYTRVLGAYGTDDRYQAGMFSNYMKNALLVTLTGSLNNTTAESLWGNMAADLKASQSPGISARKNASFNLSYEPSEKLKLTATYEAGETKTYLRQFLYRSTFLGGDSVLLNNKLSDGNIGSTRQSLRLQSRYLISSRLTMITIASAGWQKSEGNNTADEATAYTEGQTLFRRNSLLGNTTAAPSFSVQNTFLKRFKKHRRSLSLTLEAKYTSTEETGFAENTNLYFSPEGAVSNNIQKNGLNRMLGTQVSLQYTEPLTPKSLLSFKYTNNINAGRNYRTIWQDTGYRYFDTLQSRSYYQQYTENSFGLLYQYQSGALTFTAGFNVKYYDREMNIFFPAATDLKTSGVNFYPDAMIKYVFSKNSNMKISYRNSMENPSLAQLQPVPDYTDSLNVYIGNPGLNPEINHNVSVTYNYFSPRTQKMLTVIIHGKSTVQKIVNRVDLSASTRITSPVNAGNAYSADMLLNYAQPVFAKKLKAAFTLSAGTVQNITITNGQLQPVNSYNCQPSAKLIFSNALFEGECAYNYKLNRVNTSSSVQGRVLQTHTATVSGMVFLPGQARLGLNLNYIYNDGFTGSLEKQFFPVNISLEKNFTKVKGLCMRVQAYDVFNNSLNAQRTIGDNFIEDKSANRLCRYCLFSIIYSWWK